MHGEIPQIGVGKFEFSLKTTRCRWDKARERRGEWGYTQSKRNEWRETHHWWSGVQASVLFGRECQYEELKSELICVNARTLGSSKMFQDFTEFC